MANYTVSSYFCLKCDMNNHQITLISIPDWFFQSDFAQHSEGRRLLRRLRFYRRRVRLFPELVQELQTEGSSRSFVSVDGWRHEDQVRTKKFSNERKGNGGGFVDDDQLSLTQFVSVSWMDVLNNDKNLEITLGKQKVWKVVKKSDNFFIRKLIWLCFRKEQNIEIQLASVWLFQLV